ncbi:MAG: HD domain-containing protein [Thermodesulfobacteriota bacterium]
MIVRDPETWFRKYVDGFYTGIEEDDRNIELKDIHTQHVRKNMERLCASLGLDTGKRDLADLIALFHDVGRFEQYRKYRTFSDRKSVNHARLGVQVLARHHVLDGLSPAARKIVFRAVAFHNAAELPTATATDERTFMQLIRDADKLDIWRVVTDYYRRTDRSPNKTVELDLPDTPQWSRNILEALMAHRFACIADMKTLNDFKLLQIGWVFDLNFDESFRIVRERKYIEAIAETLPDVAEIHAAVQEALRYIVRAPAVEHRV